MLTFVAIVHILVAISLILLVLVQDSKGGAMGGMFAGGTSNSILGATGAASLFVKATRIAAVVFAATCVSLVLLTARERKSVVEGVAAPAPVEAPAEPTEPAAPAQTAPEAPKK